MRWRVSVTFIAVLFLWGGCKSAEKKTERPEPKRKISVRVQPQRPSEERPTVRPVDAVNGRILAVREPLRFVIADFAGGKMPRPDQRLYVYRLDQRVAEIKITGPYLGTTVAGDVISGNPMDGDLVRQE